MAPVTMFDRMDAILGVLERAREGLPLAQISARSGLPGSTVHRILQQLVAVRWVQREGNRYVLGLRMFELGTAVPSRMRIRELAPPLMGELRSATGHVVHLAVLDDQDVVYLDKIGGLLPSDPSFGVGHRVPAHCTAVGKALLAHSPPEVFDRYLVRGLRRRTRATIVDPKALAKTVARVRDCGYATELGEAVPGMACVAAPVLGAAGAIAAVSVCGPQDRVDVGEVKDRVLWTAARISRRLAAPHAGPSQSAGGPATVAR